jgi:hypothetical protein
MKKVAYPCPQESAYDIAEYAAYNGCKGADKGESQPFFRGTEA